MINFLSHRLNMFSFWIFSPIHHNIITVDRTFSHDNCSLFMPLNRRWPSNHLIWQGTLLRIITQIICPGPAKQDGGRCISKLVQINIWQLVMAIVWQLVVIVIINYRRLCFGSLFCKTQSCLRTKRRRSAYIVRVWSCIRCRSMLWKAPAICAGRCTLSAGKKNSTSEILYIFSNTQEKRSHRGWNISQFFRFGICV